MLLIGFTGLVTMFKVWLKESMLFAKFICEGAGAFNVKFFSSHASHLHFKVSLATSVSLLSGSATSSASTKNFKKLAALIQSIEEVKTFVPLPTISKRESERSKVCQTGTPGHSICLWCQAWGQPPRPIKETPDSQPISKVCQGRSA